MQLIPNYELNGSSNDGNTVSAIRSDSTSRIRLDATYTRKYASFNSSTGIYSVPTVGFVVRRDVSNGDGNPSGQRVTGTVDIRLPVLASESDLVTLIEDLRAYINDPALQSNVLKQMLPTCCAEEEA